MKALLIGIFLGWVGIGFGGPLQNMHAIVAKKRTAAGSPTPEFLWWKLNENTGTALTGDGTASDGGTTDASWTTGNAGSGLSFNGTSNKAITSGTIAFAVNQVTVTFWANSDNTGSNRRIVETGPIFTNDTGFAVYFDGADVEAALRQDGAGYMIRYCALTAGSWTHYAVTFDNSTAGGTIAIYINGSSQSLSSTADTKSGSGNFATQLINVGSRNNGAADFYDGLLDDVRIYSGLLSGAQITTVMNDPQ